MDDVNDNDDDTDDDYDEAFDNDEEYIHFVSLQIVKGRVKSVTPKLSPETPNLEPTPNYDCHVSRNPASTSATDLSTLMRSTQVQCQ